MAKCLCQMSFHNISCQKKSLKDTVGCSMSKKSVSISQNHTQQGCFITFYHCVRIFCVIFSSRPISPQLQCTTVVKLRMRPLSPGCEASLERPQNGLKRCLRILAGHVSMLPTDVKLTFPRKNFYQQNNNRKPLTPPPSCPLLWHLRGSHIFNRTDSRKPTKHLFRHRTPSNC